MQPNNQQVQQVIEHQQSNKELIYQKAFLEPNTRTNYWFGISLSFKILAIIFALTAWIITWQTTPFVSWIMFFTNQSNLWTVFMLALFAILSIISWVLNKAIIPNWLRITKFMTVVAITLTMTCYWLGMLIMTTRGDNVGNLGTFLNLSSHLFIPLISIADFLCFDYNIKIKNGQAFLCLALPVVYLITQIIIFYSTGQYPYFCLNYGSVSGWFGFNFNYSANEGKYFMGSFYWIIIFAGLLIGLSFLLKFFGKKVYQLQDKLLKPKS